MGKENLIIHIVIILPVDGRDFTPPQTSRLPFVKNENEPKTPCERFPTPKRTGHSFTHKTEIKSMAARDSDGDEESVNCISVSLSLSLPKCTMLDCRSLSVVLLL